VERPDHIFAKPDLSAVLENQFRQMRKEVSQLGVESLAGDQLPATEVRMLEKYSIEPMEMGWDRETIAKEEVMETRPSDFGNGRTFQRQEVVLRITVPFTGDKSLLEFSPTPFPNNAPRANVSGRSLEFVYQAAQHDLERLRRDHDENVRMVKSCVTKTNELLAEFHKNLPTQVRQALEARRDQLNVVDTKLAELGFAIRKHATLPTSVTFPVTPKQIVRPLPPTTPTQAAPPHRVLETQHYEEILDFLAGMSVAIERNPSTFAEVGEEPLRFWFVVALNGAFKGDATGETFNREGKTDIAIRVDGNVIFIAECKFWSGEKGLTATVDQLLGYLTWRDSKAGILLFVRNADFTAVVRQLPGVVSAHPNFMRPLPYSKNNGVRFVLRNKTDPGCEHVVTLLAF
jgi:hypothetical protein